jgi:hypothetical protein
MKRIAACVVPMVLMAAAPTASADAIDCFPIACAAEPAPQARINLCEHQAVREVARIDAKLQPVKDVYEIATNPTGYAIKMVDRHVIHIPRWVGFAMDPQGYVRGEALKYARRELKKQVGLDAECKAEIEAEDRATPGIAESEG